MKKPRKKYNCPICGRPMAEGKAEIKGDFATSLIVGFSHQWLHFNNIKVMAPNMKTRALRCGFCKITLTKDNMIAR